ncbi:peptidase S8/S53 domain-containing protein [Cladorrhinum sp. PSN332]|nr:peptidase S8/S53 domain-containing protein [Cladorrhinum sp. PSN332]
MATPRLLVSFLVASIFLPLTGASKPDGFRLASPGPVVSDDIQSLVEDHYLVEYHTESTNDIASFEQKVNQSVANSGNHYGGIVYKYDIGSFSGLHIHVSPQDYDQLKSHPAVKLIEPNAYVQHCQSRSQPQSLYKRCQGDGETSLQINNNIRFIPMKSWGAARISHRTLSQSDARNPNNDGSNTFPWQYIYTSGAPRVYLIDTGIQKLNNEFNDGRAETAQNFVPESQQDSDDHGHGTHTAAIVGGAGYGIAQCPPGRINLKGVKVLDSNGIGTWDRVLQALQWAKRDTDLYSLFSLSIVLLPLSGPPSKILHSVLQVLTSPQYNMTIIAAAGNNMTSADHFSPANSDYSITVAAIDETDHRPWFSNYGSNVTIFAPGTNIESAWIGEKNATMTLNGTSQAAAHVAGIAAYFMQVHGPHTHWEMKDRLVRFATQDMVQDLGEGSPNLIAFNQVHPRPDDANEQFVIPSNNYVGIA